MRNRGERDLNNQNQHDSRSPANEVAREVDGVVVPKFVRALDNIPPTLES